MDMVAASAWGGSPSFKVFNRRAGAGEPLSVVFLGSSLTWGANASDPQRTSYRALMADDLCRRYPRAPFTFHDAAIGGTGSQLGLFRLDRDVLARRPDLVFLDFTANDDLYGKDRATLASYEAILRELIGRGVPVVQVFVGFKYNFGPDYHPEYMLRYRDHRRLAAAYGTGVGDAFPLVQARIESGAETLEHLWPLDGAHPDDPGYALFFEAVRQGFDQAVAEGRACRVPEQPVYSDAYRTRTRHRLVEHGLPAGWTRQKTYRTSLWFDGLSSRWMDDVAVCAVRDRETVQPLRLEFSGTLVGVFGEADQDGLDFRVFVDGKPVLYRPNPKEPATELWSFNTRCFGAGRLFMWRLFADDLPPGKHTLEIRPEFPPSATNGQLRLESVRYAGETKDIRQHAPAERTDTP